MIEGVDYSTSPPRSANLKAAGKHFAGRYAVGDLEPGGRGISAAEYAELTAGGVDVFLYWEGRASWMLGGSEAGVFAANNAQANLLAAGMPPTIPVYFAHDIDPEPQHFPAIDACLQGAASVIGLQRTGVYGGWLLLDHCRGAGNARWFCQTEAWEYGRGVHPAAHLYQYDTGVRNGPIFIGGVDVDLVRALQENYGQASKFNGAGPVVIPGAQDPPIDAGSYTLNSPVPGYVTSADAAARRNSNSIVPAGVYAIFNEALGMVNVTAQPGQPGWWINPGDNGA